MVIFCYVRTNSNQWAQRKNEVGIITIIVIVNVRLEKVMVEYLLPDTGETVAHLCLSWSLLCS